MADNTRSGGVSTAKARRKNDAARNSAHGLATRGRTKRGSGGPVDEPAAEDLPSLVPRARTGPSRPAAYLITEHRRRDIGAIARAFDLTAPDAPADRVLPVPDPDGNLLQYAVVCVTHGSAPVHYATESQARKEVKSSHKWCEVCRGQRARTPATRKRATTRTKGKQA